MKPYEPENLPLENLDYGIFITLVGEASSELARYDALLSSMVDPIIMLSPMTNQEAVLSSKIEGTQATYREVLEQEAGVSSEGEKYKDIQEIRNYRKALIMAQDYLKEKPINLPFIREIHKILLTGTRGETQTPGSFRKEQNWIGKFGSTIENATFVPPNPYILNDCLEKWLNYIHYDDVDALLQVALIHAQFELIHPFRDGNGRIGRILIPLTLFLKGRLKAPMFYLSAYLETNREEYYQRLKAISTEGDWNNWILFFLRAIKEQAWANNKKLQKIIKLYDDTKQKIHSVTHSQYVNHITDFIFSRPMFNSSLFIQETGILKSTAMTLIKLLRDEGILTIHKEHAGRKPAILIFGELFNLTEGEETREIETATKPL